MAGQDQSRLRAVNLLLPTANEFVDRVHRHHDPVQGYRFALGAVDDSRRLRGVAIVGRPVARMIDQRRTVEVIRLASDGTDNVPSFLYGAAARAANALKYDRIITYILQSEKGITLDAVGWDLEDESAGGGSWNSKSRARVDHAPTEKKRRYGKRLGGCIDWRFADGWAPSNLLKCESSMVQRPVTSPIERLHIVHVEAKDVLRYASEFFPSRNYKAPKGYKFFLGAASPEGVIRGIIQVNPLPMTPNMTSAIVANVFIQCGDTNPDAAPLNVLKALLKSATDAARDLCFDEILCDAASEPIRGILRGIGYSTLPGTEGVGAAGRSYNEFTRRFTDCVTTLNPWTPPPAGKVKCGYVV